MKSIWVWLTALILAFGVIGWLGYYYFFQTRANTPAAQVVTENTDADELIQIVSQEDEETLSGFLICLESDDDNCLLGFQTQAGEIYYLSGKKTMLDQLYEIYDSGKFPLINFTGMKTVLKNFTENNYFYLTGFEEEKF